MRKHNPIEHDGPLNEAALDPIALEAIGRALRAHYDDLVQPSLPDKFMELLARLEAEERLSNADRLLQGRTGR
jgi:hypothetical protein